LREIGGFNPECLAVSLPSIWATEVERILKLRVKVFIRTRVAPPAQWARKNLIYGVTPDEGGV